MPAGGSNRREFLSSIAAFSAAVTLLGGAETAEASGGREAYNQARTTARKWARGPLLRSPDALVQALQADFNYSLDDFATAFNAEFPHRTDQQRTILDQTVADFADDSKAQGNVRLAVLIWYAYQGKEPEHTHETNENIEASYQKARALVQSTRFSNGAYTLDTYHNGRVLPVGLLNTRSSEFGVIEDNLISWVLESLGFDSGEAFAAAYNAKFSFRDEQYQDQLLENAHNVDVAHGRGANIDRRSALGAEFKNVRLALMIWIAHLRTETDTSDSFELGGETFKTTEVQKVLPGLTPDAIARLQLHHNAAQHLRNILDFAAITKMNAPDVHNPDPLDLVTFLKSAEELTLIKEYGLDALHDFWLHLEISQLSSGIGEQYLNDIFANSPFGQKVYALLGLLGELRLEKQGWHEPDKSKMSTAQRELSEILDRLPEGSDDPRVYLIQFTPWYGN
ncbi:MAG: hypothetical protein AAFO91_05200 [Bacteroidota bacterium]